QHALDIVLNGIGQLVVVVRSASGTLVAGASVHAHSSTPFGGDYSGTTDGQGRVTFPSVMAGPVSVTADKGGLGGSGTGLVLDRQSTTVDISLEATGAITGTVFAHDGSTPVAGVDVSLAGASAGSTTTSASGVFTFDTVRLGSFTLSAVRAADGDRASASGVLTSAAAKTVNLTLNGVGALHVIVHDAAGAAV